VSSSAACYPFARPFAGGWSPPQPAVAGGVRSRQNWAFHAFVLLVPLQNLHTAYVPNLGGGLNFLNLMFLASLAMALRSGGRLVHGTGVNGWMWAYMAMAGLALLVGHAHVIDPANHASLLKDHLIALSFLFLAQMSAADLAGVRRLLALSLVPLPYTAWVVWDQHAAVSSWHYDHALRISGTFPLLGANEFAAFATTALLVSGTLLLCLRTRLRWKLLLALVAFCAGLGVVLTYSRTAYVAVLLGALLVVLLRRRRMQLMLPLLALALVLPTLLPYSVVERFQSIELEEDSADKSTTDRFKYWGVALQRYGEHPLLGVGFHAFHHAEINPYRTDTHNFFLRELVEKGTVGFLVLAGLLAATWRTALRLYRRGATGHWDYALGLALLAALVAMGVANVFGDRFTYYPMVAHFWLYVGLVLRLVELRRRKGGSESPAPTSPAWRAPATAPPALRGPVAGGPAGRRAVLLCNAWNPGWRGGNAAGRQGGAGR